MFVPSLFCVKIKGMKRGGFLKRTPLKRKSKSESRKLQDLIWQHCRRIQYAKYGKTCYTCKKPVEGQNAHLGHFIPRSVGGVALRYNLDNLRPQCYYCNINLGGNGSAFYKELLKDEGQDFIDQLFALKQTTMKGSIHYLTLLEKYSNM